MADTKKIRFGRFTISISMLSLNQHEVAEILSWMGFVPFSVNQRYDLMVFEYMGWSDRFDEIDEGDEAPMYDIITTEDPEVGTLHEVRRMN